MTISAADRKKSILLVFLCTLFGALAQVLMKKGAGNIVPHETLSDSLLALATNLPLIAAYSCYALNLILLTMALRHGELSAIYPIIALTYVWVGFLSVLVFHEIMTPLKATGLATIVLGVALIGRGSKS